jgi:hypothetical protein
MMSCGCIVCDSTAAVSTAGSLSTSQQQQLLFESVVSGKQAPNAKAFSFGRFAEKRLAVKLVCEIYKKYPHQCHGGHEWLEKLQDLNKRLCSQKRFSGANEAKLSEEMNHLHIGLCLKHKTMLAKKRFTVSTYIDCIANPNTLVDQVDNKQDVCDIENDIENERVQQRCCGVVHESFNRLYQYIHTPAFTKAYKGKFIKTDILQKF